MERTISISTDVFARIWSLRQEGEDSEDAILRRLLLALPRQKRPVPTKREPQRAYLGSPGGRVTWRDDVRAGLERLNGTAPLLNIYREVREIRKMAGRSIPVSFEPVVRRTLEEHSSESEVYRGGPDLFWMPEGKGAGIWALR